MALGFGFNKAKVLSSAEKFVQQGKLQNAISEYEKVIKEDPKDLTVLNTIGDLYARVGEGEKACEYFKKVGDQYAQNGFTVKAIAIYKKLSKLTTASDAVIKLAELYTHQGLFNDARAHYMQVADQLLKTGDNNQAAKIFQKILELDPENTSTQSKLAELYIKLGRKDEARDIYYSAAASLYGRKAFDAADEALGRVLSLDPENKKAILLRGMTAAEAGDTAAAVQYLEQVPDLDSHPDGLRALLRAKLQTGAGEGTESLAVKLFTVHQDLSGITGLAEWLVAHQRVDDALKLYDEYAERLFSAGTSSIVGTLYPLIGRVRDDPAALERIQRLLQKAGDTSHLNEILELLAHARVQTGNFEQARDLYKELSELEPENPLHVQNYRQMLAKLGEDPMSRTLTSEEGTQALMVEELEHSAPAVHQEYSQTVEKALDAALTDAELFISYNVPLKAIAPLEAALPMAPRDLRLNQRLASLYLRAGRYADAVNACKVLSELYTEFGYPAEAQRYAAEAAKYSGRAAVETPVAPAPAQPEPEIKKASSAEAAAPTVQELMLEVPGDFFDTPVAETPAEPISAPNAAPSEAAAISQEPVVQEFHLEAATEAQTQSASPSDQPQEIEIDVSHEWESMLTVEPESAIQPSAAEPAATSVEPVASAPDAAVIEDKVQEIRFYISQGFWDMAQAAIHDLSEVAPQNPQIEELKAAIATGAKEAAKAAEEKHAAEAAKAAKAEEKRAAEAAKAKAAEEKRAAEAAKAKAAEEKRAAEAAKAAKAAEEKRAAEVARAAKEAEEKRAAEAAKTKAAEEKRAAEAARAARAAAAHAKTDEFVLDVAEQSPAAKAEKSVPIKEKKPTKPSGKLEPEEDVLGDLVLDLEQSLGDFVPGGASPPHAENVTPSHAKQAAGAAAGQAKSSSPAIHAPTASSAATNGGIHDAESASVLSDILSELQEDLGEDVAEAEDPETHYNLGIAFKEMGLLDEAIGELQKVCHSVEQGAKFSQPIQAYTWLAQCLVDKGVPEAAVRWYQKALQLPGLDDGSRCAIYYDLGSAYEASGDRKSALANFMEVYSSNIDFRDVASRIKVLKS